MEIIKIGKTNDAFIFANWNCMGDGFIGLGELTDRDLANMTPDFKILCDSGCYPTSVNAVDKNIYDEAYQEYTK